SAWNRNVIQLGQIMVVRGEPENGDSIDSGGGGLFRKSDCTERFVDGEHGSAEKANLLPGDDRCRAITQALEIGEGSRGGVPGSILALEDSGNSLAAGRIVGNPGSFFFQPFGEMGRPRIERLYFRGKCKEVCDSGVVCGIWENGRQCA